MNTRETAEAIGTDPKRLRRFLRADATYRNAGQGGRYEFTKKDLPTLKKRFDAWSAKNAKPADGAPVSPRRRRAKDEVGPVPAHVANVPAHALTPEQRAEVRRVSEARVDRLEEKLMAAGLHISQMRARS